MFCLNQSTGMIRWSKQIPEPVMASPVTIKDKVFFAASDKIMGLQVHQKIVFDFDQELGCYQR
jgi:outer membrane protein assembly factor BamB